MLRSESQEQKYRDIDEKWDRKTHHRTEPKFPNKLWQDDTKRNGDIPNKQMSVAVKGWNFKIKYQNKNPFIKLQVEIETMKSYGEADRR